MGLTFFKTFSSIFSASALKKTQLREGLYTKKEISPNYTLFWRIIPDTQEIEMAMRVKGTGFVGIGWRPKSASKSCQAYPKLQDPERVLKKLAEELKHHDEEDDVQSEAESEAEGEAESEAEAESEGEAEAEDTSLEEDIEKASQEDSSELVRRARKIVNKHIDVSIGYVTSSVSTGKRRKRQAEGMFECTYT